jgi:hypothetical protein
VAGAGAIVSVLGVGVATSIVTEEAGHCTPGLLGEKVACGVFQHVSRQRPAENKGWRMCWGNCAWHVAWRLCKFVHAHDGTDVNGIFSHIYFCSCIGVPSRDQKHGRRCGSPVCGQCLQETSGLLEDAGNAKYWRREISVPCQSESISAGQGPAFWRRSLKACTQLGYAQVAPTWVAEASTARLS